MLIPGCGYVCHPRVIGHELGFLSSQYPQMVSAADNTHWAFGFGMLYSRCRAVHPISGDCTVVSLRGPASESDIADAAAPGSGDPGVERQRRGQCQGQSTSLQV